MIDLCIWRLALDESRHLRRARPAPSGTITSVLLCLLLIGTLTSCEEKIDPFVPIDGIYAINGYLDAAADTQWVRVTPFRTSILITPDPVDAVVTLEHLGTGKIVEMHPSIFVFPNPNFGGEAYGHNFWTDEPIERGASYRLVAQRSDGESATATVRIPHGLVDRMVWVGVDDTNRRTSGRANQLAQVRFDLPDGDYLTFLDVEHHRRLPDSCDLPIDHILDHFHSDRPPPGPLTYEWSLLRWMDPEFACFGQGSRYIRWIASIILTGERWPFLAGDPVGHIAQGSNIENGMGYLGGVVSEKVPLPLCALSGPGAPILCELFFGPETATLDVYVRDHEGALRSTGDAYVSLRKGGESWTRWGDSRDVPSSPGAPLVRGLPDGVVFDSTQALTRFPGLLPGEYRIEIPILNIRPTDIPIPQTFCEERTVILAPREHRSIEIQQVRINYPITEPVNSRGCREG